MKVLIVGCGAVGQVFGLHLQNAGVELGLYDRPAILAGLKRGLEHGGMPVFQISNSRGREPGARRLVKYQVVMDEAGCRRFKPDQIWFAVPSPVYHSGWFREFLQKVPSGRVVCFAPEGRRPEFIPDGVDGDRLVFGGITFMAWQGGPEGGGGRQGVNFWRSPLGIPLAGEKSACGEVGRLLKKAGFRFSVGKPDSRLQASVTAVMTAFTAGLELAGWSLRAYRGNPWLRRAACASREMVLSQLPEPGLFTRLLVGILSSTACFFLAALCLPLLFPFDIEKYMMFHYRKTREQTLALLGVYLRDGSRRSLPVEHIRALLQELQHPAQEGTGAAR
jgi:hypothetical protein